MAKTPPFAEFAKRLFVAQRRYELKKGVPLDRDAFAKRVAKGASRDKAFSSATVSQWFNGNQMPSVGQLEAIAKELEVHPGWLAFGQAGAVMTPDGEELPASSEPPKSKPRQRSQPGQK